MNAIKIASTCNEVRDYLRKCPGLTLKAIKEIYEDSHGEEFPFSTELGDDMLHKWLVDTFRIGFEKDFEGEICYFLKEDPEESDGKRKANSPVVAQSTQVKRSKSAPFDDDKENLHERKGQRQPRLVRFENEVNGGESFKVPVHTVKMTRSRSENRPKGEENCTKAIENRSKGEAKVLPHFYNCTLIGDDFLIGFAIFDLGFKRNNVHSRSTGFCIAGLTIAGACKKLQDMKNCKIEKAIVYLGSYDFIKGLELIQMIDGYDRFLDICKAKNIQVVACTLAPIPGHQGEGRKEILEGFNKYIRSRNVAVIDVYKGFVETRNGENIHRSTFYTDFKEISGADKPVKFWNNYGRDKFRNILLKNLGQALVADKFPNVFTNFCN